MARLPCVPAAMVHVLYLHVIDAFLGCCTGSVPQPPSATMTWRILIVFLSLEFAASLLKVKLLFGCCCLRYFCCCLLPR